MARAVSTVLDVSVSLLLVGVAVTTLGFAVPVEDEPSQIETDTTANSIGTVTASVPVAGDRRAHDTLAGHLTAAAMVNGSIDGIQIGSARYPESVRRTVRNRTDERTHVTVRWRPYPDAPLRGHLAVGPKPPSTADVSVTRWRLDSGIDAPKSLASFEATATSLSTAYVTRLFPPERTRIALVDPRTAPRTAERYRAFAEALETDVDDALADASPRRANEQLASALADRLESDLRKTYTSPVAATNERTESDTELVIRRWEP